MLLVSLLAVLLHVALLGAASRGPGLSGEPRVGVPMAVRMVSVEAEAALPVPPPAPAAPAAVDPVAPRPVPPVPRPRSARTPTASSPETLTDKASARTKEPASGPTSEPEAALAAASAAEPADSVASAPAVAQAAIPAPSEPVAAPALAGAEAAPPEAAPGPAPAAPASFLAAGEQPPPTYRTALPAPVTLRYQVRRGFFRGSGEIRWQPGGGRYQLHLDARLAGIPLLSQTSQGEIGSVGLAPERFVDQRARRPAQAANFRRDSDTVTFSGPATVWPLLAGTQDRLSWMIQLVGIVAADPERATDGSRISMVLVGARGEASVRTLRFAGREHAEIATGSVPALKFVVDGRSAYDTSYDIWLDPARGFLPVHATARNGAGESEFDLLLERTEP
ncbi:MAG: DUF3108 domain-containing protein [Caldimonas sp.]